MPTNERMNYRTALEHQSDKHRGELPPGERRGHGPAAGVLVGALLLLAQPAWATIYYVSQGAGHDGNAGTSATSGGGASGPWKTIARVNASRFLPGDAVLFERGGVWRETLKVPSSGAAGRPITFGAYGVGADPVLSGADLAPASRWTYEGGGYYSNGDYAARMKGVYRNGVRLTLAASKADLDSPEEWWWDAAARRVYLWDAATHPGTEPVEVTVRDYGVYNDAGQEYYTCAHLDVQKVQVQAFRFGNWTGAVRHGITVDACRAQVEDSGQVGANAAVYITGNAAPVSWDGITITNNTFRGGTAALQNWGVYLVQYGTNFEIAGNTITDEGEDGITVWKSTNGRIADNTLPGGYWKTALT